MVLSIGTGPAAELVEFHHDATMDHMVATVRVGET